MAKSGNSFSGNELRSGMRFPSHGGVSEAGSRAGVAGFSMIELLIVLVLIAIMTSLAAPSLNAYIGRTKTRRALDRIATDLAYARMSAVRAGRSSTMQFQTGGVYRIDVAGARTNPIRRVELGREFTGIAVETPSPSLEFNSRGMLLTDPGRGRIVVRLGSLQDSLVITRAGRVYRDF